MKPQEIEDRIIIYTSKATGRTVQGRIGLHQTPGYPDQWRIVHNTGSVQGGATLQEDILLPYEAHEDVRLIDGKLVLEF